MPVNMQELKFKVLEYVRMRGPVIPVQISKQIGSNILFAGAVLSELLAGGKIKISTAKIGGSPVYYFPGQESRLTILYPYLHQREKHVYDLLKEKKILHDKSLEPVERVALREIKDFAYPIQVNDELFWRWYLTGDNETQIVLNELFNQAKTEQEIIKEPEKIEIKPEAKEEIITKPELKIQEKQPVKIEAKKEAIKEPEIKKRIKREPKVKSDFNFLLKKYFNEKNIKIIEENLVKKDKEFEYVVEVPSQIGNVRFFLSAKDKKKINDADLSLVHNKSQLKKLPLMILTNGDLTKQAKEYINNNYLIFEKI